MLLAGRTGQLGSRRARDKLDERMQWLLGACLADQPPFGPVSVAIGTAAMPLS